MGIIALLTDFGVKDPYVGVMKGIILSIDPNAVIIDVTHGVGKYQVLQGALILKSCYKYFPKGTIFTVVVDPGVGSVRRAIIIRASNYVFIGPDNGVLTPAAFDDGVVDVYEIKKYLLPVVSRTFHGRDIFAPAAAYISKGGLIKDIGEEIDVNGIVTVEIGGAEVRDGEVVGRVIYIDSFGNAVTNIHPNNLRSLSIDEGDLVNVEVNGVQYKIPWVKAYSDVKQGKLLIITNSFNYIELSVNQGNASKTLRLKVGSEVVVKPCR
jgi:S-adenosylmethionine hydrolase